MTKWIFRITIGLGFALPMLLLSAAFVQADNIVQPSQTGECSQCHSDIFKVWEAGAHGQAASDKVFQDTWQAQGKPEPCLACHTTGYDPLTGDFEAEGVTCVACHGPIPVKHPAEPMPTDRAACGTCHTNTLLEWQVSAHRANNLNCVDCHNSHGTQLKAASPSELCVTCHKDHATQITHTGNVTQDLSCADCHLAREASTSADAHIVRSHTFEVKLSTCNQCHADQMHGVIAKPTADEDDTQSAVTATTTGAADRVAPKPEPMNPTGFAALAIVLGFGGGVVVAPWLERWHRNNNRH